MDPTFVTLLGINSLGKIVQVQFDKNGVLQVSPPTRIPSINSNLSVLVEQQAELLNALTIDYPAANFPNGLAAVATIAALFTQNFTTGNLESLITGDATVDNFAPSSNSNLITLAQMLGFDGTSMERVRVANVFKTVSVTAAGLNAVWTPAAGKRFRLMGYNIDIAGTLAATGVQALTLRDGAATVIANHIGNVIQTPTVNISGGADHIQANWNQGRLSAAANNVLNINLGTAMATGAVTVNAWGTEE